MILHVRIIPEDKLRGYYVKVDEIPFVHTQGDTIKQCIENSYEAIELALEDPNDRKKLKIPKKVKVEFIVEGSTINVG